MAEKYVYKVVSRSPTGLKSFSLTGSYRVDYSLGVETKPKIGKLFVFKTLERAKEWARETLEYPPVLKCCFTGELTECKIISFLHMEVFIKNFWSSYPNHRVSEEPSDFDKYLLSAPQGTFLVDSVTPIELC